MIIMRGRLLQAKKHDSVFQELLMPGAFVDWEAATLCLFAKSLKDGDSWFTIELKTNISRKNYFRSSVWNWVVPKRTYDRLRSDGQAASKPTSPDGDVDLKSPTKTLTSPNTPGTGSLRMRIEGYLVKTGEGTLGKLSYKLRWFTLDSGLLRYYTNENVWREGKSPIKSVNLTGKSVRVVDQKRFHFCIAPKQITGRRYDLYASDLHAMQLWVSAISAASSCAGYGMMLKRGKSSIIRTSLMSYAEAPF